MSFSELQTYTAVSKYAVWLKDKKRREIWEESVFRARDMMLGRYPDLENEILEAYNSFVLPMKVLGSQRALQFGGQPALKHNARVYNCAGSYCDRLRFFQEFFYVLLCGSGFGFSVQDHHIRKLPRYSKARRAGRKLPKKEYVVPDSIEGWSYCPSVLLSAYMEQPVKGFEEYHECEPVFRLHQIRPKGSELSFGIGTAPGPRPLLEAILAATNVLQMGMGAQHDRIDSLTAYDFAMHWANSVSSGGVRRSATSVIFDLWDKKMATAKTGNWRQYNSQRGRSNNSACLIRNKTEFDEFNELFRHTKEFGEPGFYWTDHPDMLPNPCFEIGFWCRYAIPVANKAQVAYYTKDYDGPIDRVGDEIHLSGVQFCNLSTINGLTVEDKEDFYERCRQTSFIGTLQADFTSFPELGPVTEAIVRREALLGVAICGIMNKPEILLDPYVQRRGAGIVVKTNEKYSNVLGINPAARTTCGKPDGNTASLLACLPGIGAGKFKHGFRIAQANRMEAPYRHFRSINPSACETSVWKPQTDDCIRFCVEYPDDTLMESDMSAIEFLENVRSTYMNWVEPGKTTERCAQPWLSHNISNTVVVRDHEWDGVAKHLYKHRDCYAGVSFLGENGHRDYAQAPFTPVYFAEEQQKMYPGIPLGLAKGLAEECPWEDLWKGCDYANRVFQFNFRELSEAKKLWLQSVWDFAKMYFRNQTKLAVNCIKDQFNLGKWNQLKAEMVVVDWTQMVESVNGVQMVQEVACTGGQCEI